MTTARAPLRLPLGGGGTDLPSYADRHGAGWLSAALDLWATATVVAGPAPIEPGPIERAALDGRDLEPTALHLTCTTPLPSGTGLGSSGAVATAAVAALDAHQGIERTAEDLAREAHRVEVAALGPTAGYQDPWIAALGGLRWFQVAPGGAITHRAVAVPGGRDALARHLALFPTGGTRASATVLADQVERQDDPTMLDNLAQTAALGVRALEALEAGDLDAFAHQVEEHWATKRRRSPGMTDPHVDALHDLAVEHGALGAKLVGAGGCGHLLVCGPDLGGVRQAFAEAGSPELPVRFSAGGAEVVER